MNGLRELIVAKDNPTTFIQSARTAVAAVVSLLVASLFRLPEPYWAAITTLIVMQSSLGAALPVSVQRFAGTAVGATLGALIGSLQGNAGGFPGKVASFGAGVFALGMLGAAVRAERGAYRYAGITLAIVMLFPRPENPWIIAVHRFCEVSIGIAVGLALTALWPERRSGLKTVE